MTRPFRGDPYPWPFDGDLRPENTALIVIDMQTDFCGRAAMSTRMGYDISLTRAPIEPIRSVLDGDARQGLPRHPHPRGSPARPRATCPPTSAGARGGSAPASAIRARAAASWCAASPAGRSSRSLRRHAGEPIIDKPGKGSFCATDLELVLRTQGHPQHRAHRHHHRRLRPHHDARGQRPRLRVPAAGGLLRARPTPAIISPRSRWSRCRAACSARSSNSRDFVEALP